MPLGKIVGQSPAGVNRAPADQTPESLPPQPGGLLDLQEAGERTHASEHPHEGASCDQAPRLRQGEIAETDDLLERSQRKAEIKGEQFYQEEKKAQRQQAAQDPEGDAFDEKRQPDERIGGADQPEDLDLRLAGEDVQ